MTINRIDMEEITDRIDELREARDEYNEKMGDPEAWARIDDGEPEAAASRVSTRWPPLAPKKESGCIRLSRKEVTPASSLPRPRRR